MEEQGSSRDSDRGPKALIRRLLRQIRRRVPAPGHPAGDVDQPAPDDLAPEGRRSGEGAESITPYLDQARNSRPTPLE